MAVSLADLAIDLRLLATPPAAGESTSVPPGLEAAQVLILTRLLAVAETLVAERAPGAPDPLKDAATVALSAYLYDRPSAGAGTRFANAWANSGASELLSAYLRRRALVIGGPTAAAATEPGGSVPSRPMPATPAEAAGGTSTTIRSWTAALIRHAVDARVARIEQRLDVLE